MTSEVEEKASEDRIFGSYLFKNYTNEGKIKKINSVLKKYRKNR